MGTSQRERVDYFDFVRCIAIVIVVCFHCACSYNGHYNIFYSFANGGWGSLGVTMFFILSGVGLSYNYPEIPNLNKYFFKRWKSIFPMFYIAWLPVYIRISIIKDNFFWGGNPLLLILTFFGLDGYFLYLHSNYYIWGEWFLGAIIIIYCLFPLLNVLYKKYFILTSILLLMLYVFNLLTDVFKINPFTNPITCVASFWIGMIIVNHKEILTQQYLNYILIIICLSIILEKISLNTIVSVNLLGISLFILSMNYSKIVITNIFIRKVVTIINKYSYPIYLVHHVIIYRLVRLFPIESLNLGMYIFLLILVFTISFISAVIVYKINIFIFDRLKYVSR